MKRKFGKQFILMPIGLFMISGTLLISQFKNMPDFAKGILFGIGIGLIALPIFLKRFKSTNG